MLPKGVTHIKGSKKGPKVGLIACTHGDETIGLHAFRKLKTYLKSHPLIKGEIFLITNNLKAKESKNRYCDINMNRLPPNALAQKNPKASELKRLQKLFPIMQDLDYVLDLHSTSTMAEPMVIILNQKIPQIAKTLGIQTIVCNMQKIQKGRPFISFCGNSKAVRLGIECGIHNSTEAKKVVHTASMNFLEKIGIIQGKKSSKKWPKSTLYKVSGSIVAPGKEYRLVRNFKPFELLTKGSIILQKEDGGKVTIAQDCHAFLPPKSRIIKYPDEELFFTIQKL